MQSGRDAVQRGYVTYNLATGYDYRDGPKGYVRALEHAGPGQRRRSRAPAGLKMRFSGSGHISTSLVLQVGSAPGRFGSRSAVLVAGLSWSRLPVHPAPTTPQRKSVDI